MVPSQRERQRHLPGPHQQGRFRRLHARRAVRKAGRPPRPNGLGWACSASAAGASDQGKHIFWGHAAEGVQALSILMAKPGLFLGWDVALFHHRSLGTPGVPLSTPLLPLCSWSRHVLPFLHPLARKLQTLLLPNHHHLPLLGFAAPLFLRQLAVGLCCWLLSAGVSALDQVGARAEQRWGTRAGLIHLCFPHLCPETCAVSRHVLVRMAREEL